MIMKMKHGEFIYHKHQGVKKAIKILGLPQPRQQRCMRVLGRPWKHEGLTKMKWMIKIENV